MRLILAVLGLVGVAIAGSPAEAFILTPVDLPAAFASFSCSGTQAAVYSATGCDAGNVKAEVTLGRFPQASAVATYSGNLALEQSSAYTAITYSFAVTGGPDGRIVPVDFLLGLVGSAGSTNGGSYYFASVIVRTDQGSVSRTICAFGCGSGDGALSYSGVLRLGATAGHINVIEMSAVAANGLSQDALSAYAVSDPYIYVDPSFADADDYSIVVSEGVGNSPQDAVPEPPVWALLLAGFGCIGHAVRRGRVALRPQQLQPVFVPTAL